MTGDCQFPGAMNHVVDASGYSAERLEIRERHRKYEGLSANRVGPLYGTKLTLALGRKDKCRFAPVAAQKLKHR
jgi:hypothetical protein